MACTIIAAMMAGCFGFVVGCIMSAGRDARNEENDIRDRREFSGVDCWPGYRDESRCVESAEIHDPKTGHDPATCDGGPNE